MNVFCVLRTIRQTKYSSYPTHQNGSLCKLD